MANTRRRSRAGETANTQRQQCSASHATSIAEEDTAVLEELSPVTVADSAEDASPHIDSPISRSTKGFCRNCGSNIGEYYNSWHKVTGSYYVPALLGSYKSLLRCSGKQKAASRGTAIEGCTIQPLSCPASISSTGTHSSSCTDSPIGFTVVDAPVAKRNFRGRDFFKLGRIELRCELSPRKIIVVQPKEDTAFDLENSDSPSPAQPRAPTEETMEIDSRPSATQTSGPHYVHLGQRHEHHQHHQPLQRMEGSRHSLPPLSSVPSPTTLAPLHSIPPKPPSKPQSATSPAVKPIYETPYTTQPSPRDFSMGLPSRGDIPLAASQVRSATELPHINGHAYPRPPGEVSLDAIERLQTQISQNSGALAAHTRDIRRGEESFQQLETTFRREFAVQVQRQSMDISRVDEAVARLHLEMQGMRQILESVNHELAMARAERQRGVAAPLGQSTSAPDAALELMAQQVAAMSHKTTEVDNLRVTVEIMKKKIHHLEQGSASTPASQIIPQFSQSLHGSLPSQNHATAALRHQPTTTPGLGSPVQAPLKAQTHQSVGLLSSSTVPESFQGSESTPNQSSGWASINTGTKRTHTNGVGSPREGAIYVPGSPKRQKSAAVDSQAISTPAHHPHESMDSGDLELRHYAPPPTLPSQHSIPETVMASQTRQPVHTSYSTQEGPSDDSWGPEAHHLIEHRPRGRGRGGGPGSRGGRIRRSIPSQVNPLSTPEGDGGDDWQGVSESQAGSDGFYNHIAHSVRSIARRGSGGGGRGGYARSDRATSFGSQGVSPGFGMGSPNDPYAHTKKTRTKPIRNSDGVLIRKDGRPDMRSQSSAANLRKVHARKEGDLSTHGSPNGFTPTNLHHAASAEAPDTPSPSIGYTQLDQDAPASVRQKHNAIMGKMFPSGVDESRKANDYAHQVFEEDRDHSILPRSQNLHHNSQASATTLQIKKEQFEQRRLTSSQSPHECDIDMDPAEEHDRADSGAQTLSHHKEQFRNNDTREQSETQSI